MMNKKDDNVVNIYVGNLPFRLSSKELRELFEQYGEVAFAKIIRERETKRSKGFGFIEMLDKEEANTAIESLNNSTFKGRTIIVNVAHERKTRSFSHEQEEEE